MKRNIITLLITVFAMLQATAQTYDNLWKQADIIAQKDQPKSEIGVMKKIISKATAAKDYGQLLAADETAQPYRAAVGHRDLQRQAAEGRGKYIVPLQLAAHAFFCDLRDHACSMHGMYDLFSNGIHNRNLLFSNCSDQPSYSVNGYSIADFSPSCKKRNTFSGLRL